MCGIKEETCVPCLISFSFTNSKDLNKYLHINPIEVVARDNYGDREQCSNYLKKNCSIKDLRHVFPESKEGLPLHQQHLLNMANCKSP